MDNSTTISIKQNITPAQAAKLLEQHGMLVTEKEAKIVLDFLYTLAGSTIHYD